MSERMLRGRAALTIVRGNSGAPGRHVYFSQLVDPRDVNPEDRDRLVAENYLEWVVLDGETWKLAEAGDSGDAGESVTVGSTALADSSADPGLVNAVAQTAATAEATAGEAKSDDDPEAKAAAEAAELEARREAARAKLPTDGSAPHHNAGEDVWREYAVSKGMDRAEVEKASKDDLKAALKS